jgi:hypothetical protein
MPINADISAFRVDFGGNTVANLRAMLRIWHITTNFFGGASSRYLSESHLSCMSH